MSPSDPPVAAPSEIQTEPCPRCGTICPAGWCGVCHAPILPPAAPPPHQHIDVEAMRSNLHATFGKGWDDSRDGRQAFHHGMDHVCNALAAWQRGESTNGILPDPWLSQGGWVALDRIDKLVQQLRADFGRERDRNQVLETELAALRTSRVAAPTPHYVSLRERLWKAGDVVKAIDRWRESLPVDAFESEDSLRLLRALASLPTVAAPTPETPEEEESHEPPAGGRIIKIFRNGSWLEDSPAGRRKHYSWPDVPTPETPSLKDVEQRLNRCLNALALELPPEVHGSASLYIKALFKAQRDLLAGPQSEKKTTKDDDALARGDRRGSSVGFGTAGKGEGL